MVELRRVGEAVAADLLLAADLQANGKKLPGLERRDRLAVGWAQVERDLLVGLVLAPEHLELPPALPRLASRDERAQTLEALSCELHGRIDRALRLGLR